MKKIVSFLLVLCTLLSLFPVAVTAAEETLPKDESGLAAGTVSQGESKPALTDYDRLYVGADGSATANGGTLVGLFTAFGEDTASIDLDAGLWKNKLSGADATLRENTIKWQAGENGGILYRSSYAEWAADGFNTGLSLPESLFTGSDFAVEALASYLGVTDENGNIYTTREGESNHYKSAHKGDASYVRLELMAAAGFCAYGSSNSASLGLRWFLTMQSFKEHTFGSVGNGTKQEMVGNDAAYRSAMVGGQPIPLVSSYSKNTRTDGSVSYVISYSSGDVLTAELTAEKHAAYRAVESTKEKATLYSLFNAVPTAAYAVRVYTAPLTDAEKAHNAFVDLMAYRGVSLDGYLSLDSTKRAGVESMFSKYGFDATKEEISGLMSEVIKLFSQEVEAGDLLYVTEGLTGIFSSFEGYSTALIAGATASQWVNGLNVTQTATLKGEGWHAEETSGFTIYRTYEEYQQNKTFGVYLPAELLPEKDFTLEFVSAPMGLSTIDEDGNRVRYIDTITSTGTWNEYGIGVGPFRAYQAACYREPGKDAQLERRWVYNATGGISQNVPSGEKWKNIARDTVWAGLDLHEVVTTTLSMRCADNVPSYSFFHNGEAVFSLDIESEKYKTNAESGNMFQLMVGVAGTIYSVRVYDRVLTSAERQRNHVADLHYFYGIDVSALFDLVAGIGNVDDLFDAFADMGFDLTKEQAQAEFNTRLAALWVRYGGMGAKLEQNGDSIRYYFNLAPGVTALMSSGVAFEIGAVVSIGKNTLPALEGMDYDYKIVAYDTDGGKSNGFFVDDDTFAVTVKYANTEKRAALTEIGVRGYVKVFYEDGTEGSFYAESSSDTCDNSNLFTVYHRIQSVAGVTANGGLVNRMSVVLGMCYERLSVFLDAGAADGGNGTESAPFNSFGAAWADCKSKLATLAAPTKLLLRVKDGEYGVYDTATLSGEDMLYPYSEFDILAEGGNAVFTTTVDIDGADFTKYADNIWVYQFKKDETGNYPAFRYLYVDGRMSDIAYSSGQNAVDDDIYLAAFERYYDAPWGYAEALYKAGKLNGDVTNPYPDSRPDLQEAFDTYVIQFRALGEEKGYYSVKKLTFDTVSSYPDDPIYNDAFEHYKLTDLALDDMREQYKNGTAVSSLKPKASNDAAYKEIFNAIRTQMIDDGKEGSFSYYAANVSSKHVIDIGKYYVSMDMIGDESRFAEVIAEHKARAEAEYNAVKEKYDAADAAGKEALAEALAEAELRVAADTWFRYNVEDVQMEMHLNGQWWHNIVGITGIDYDDVAMDADGNAHVAIYLDLYEYSFYQVHKTYSMVNRYICIKNSPSYLDEEFESYYDEENGRIYYYSEDGMKDKKVAYPTNDYMFVLTDVRDLTFEGITFTGVDDYYMTHNPTSFGLGFCRAEGDAQARMTPDRSAVLLNYGKNVTFYGCDFVELGCKGIQADYWIDGLRIESCEFARLGANAIYVGAGRRDRYWQDGYFGFQNVIISDNYIHNVALEYHATTAVWMTLAKDVKITNNTIHDCSYSGIGVGYTFGIPSTNPGENGFYHMYNVEIAYNYITNFMTEVGDGAAIYVTGGTAPKENTDYFNFMHHNFVVMSNITGDGQGHMVVGLYFDGSTSNWRCYENVVVGQSYGAVWDENEGFDKEDPDTAEYLTELRARRTGTTLIYLQHITSQITHNIRCDDNWIINVRAGDPEAQLKEAYKTYVVADRNLVEQNTHYVKDPGMMPPAAEDIIYSTGSTKYPGDPYWLYDNNY